MRKEQRTFSEVCTSHPAMTFINVARVWFLHCSHYCLYSYRNYFHHKAWKYCLKHQKSDAD